MVSLHTSWDAFSFISVSFVSVRASYSGTRSQVSPGGVTGSAFPSKRSGAGPPLPRQTFPRPATRCANFHPHSGSFVPSTAHVEFPAHPALNILSSSRPDCSLVPSPRTHMDVPSSDTVSGVASYLYLTSYAQLLVFKGHLPKLLHLPESYVSIGPWSLAHTRNRQAFKNQRRHNYPNFLTCPCRLNQ